MANAAATITIYPYPRGIDNTQRFQVVRGTIAISAGTYPLGGFPLTWGSLSNANGAVIESIPLPASTPSSTGTVKPTDMDVKSTAYTSTNYGTGPSGYIYIWDSVNGNLHIFEDYGSAASTSSGPLVEMGGNVPGLVVNDTIQFTAYFPRNN